MQISGLTPSGSFGSSDVLAIEINGVTYKLTGNTLASALKSIGNYQGNAEVGKALKIDCGTVSSLPKTVTNSSITADMVVVESVLGTPSAQTGDWTVTTAAGSLTIAGSISGSTTLVLYLARA